ncbi:MAG: hypothetical protein GY796_19370 [Chloroflexi bacterium]|nr:hypothetical protein [Chloroflexota bacterium]
MSTPTITQQTGFRQTEVDRLFTWASAGESAAVIGMSGTGKSNLFNHLQDTATQTAWGLDSHIILVRVNFHYIPDLSDRTVYSLILEQLEILPTDNERLGLSQEIVAEIGRYHEKLLDAKDDILKAQRYFKLAIRALLANGRYRLILLCDQFDELFQEAEPHLFANLRGLREAYKYRLSYFVFTRDLLANLAELDNAREEFVELMASNVLGLKPYRPDDALSLLKRIAQRNQRDLLPEWAQILLTATGGHAGLLRAGFLGVSRPQISLPADGKTAVETLLRFPGVEIECEKIWRSLSPQERRLLSSQSRHLPLTDDDSSVQKLLQLKGVLTESPNPRLFSSLFARYVSQQEIFWDQPVYFDEAARQIWVMGQPAPSLTKLEFRLFRLLYEYSDEVVEKERLVSAGWPNAKGGVSDEALVAAIARLRKKIEPDANTPRRLQNVHNQGYILRLDSEG